MHSSTRRQRPSRDLAARNDSRDAGNRGAQRHTAANAGMAAESRQKTGHDSRRGLTASENELLLAAAAHNLRKLHRHRLQG